MTDETVGLPQGQSFGAQEPVFAADASLSLTGDHVPTSFAAGREGIIADDMSDIAMRGGFLTVITLSIYRFWRKTRERKLIWRETRIGNDAFEYTGTALELLVGFMIAVVILGVWLAVANLGLAYVQMAAWQDFETSFLLAPIVASPLIAFAMYRARRYRVLRTRWRGIRMGMDGSGMAFAMRWMGWTFLQIVTLGLATPWKTMALERYMTEHMMYGRSRFSFVPRDGAMRRLFLNVLVPWLPLAVLAVVGLVLALSQEDLYSNLEIAWEGIRDVAESEDRNPVALAIQAGIGFAFLPLLMAYPLYLRYRSRELAELISARRVEGVRFHSNLTWKATSNPWLARLLRSILLGSVVWTLAFLVAAVAAFSAMSLGGFDFQELFSFSEDGSPEGAIGSGMADVMQNPLASGTFLIGLYMAYGLIIVFGLWLNFVVSYRRRITHLCNGTYVTGLGSLDDVTQRSRTEQAESEGFADALDVGGL